MDKSSIISVIQRLYSEFETEILELKQADNSFKVRDLGVYFSALSNEANLKGKPCALLIFGIGDNGAILGTSYMREPGFPEIKSKGLQRLKRAVAEQTNNRITFREIHELDLDGKRIVVFEIPPATRGIPTQWAGAAWAREGESLAPLPLNKIDEIRSQPPADWGKQLVEGATLSDLDPEAIVRVRDVLMHRYGNRSSLIDTLDDAELLDKAGLTLRGAVTNAALMLLGTLDAAVLFGGPAPRVTWSLYESDGRVRAYEHFGPPFLLTIDDVLMKIRNERYRIMDIPNTLIPREIDEYDSWTLRELVGNALAHQSYESGRRVNVEEFPDRIEVLNEGSFIPGTLDKALQTGYKPTYYRNPFLCDAMLQVGLLDQNAMGIRTICENARTRRMPLPTYDLSDESCVRVVVYNHEIDSAYTAIVASEPDLSMPTLLALDRIQKGQPCSESEAHDLFERGFAERRTDGSLALVVPQLSAAARFNKESGPGATQNAGIANLEDAIKQMLLAGPLTRVEIATYLEPTYGNGRDFGEKTYRTLRNLEQKGEVVGEGSTRAKVWKLAGHKDIQ